MSFGNRLAQMLTDKGYTQLQLSQQTKIDRGAISHYVRDRRVIKLHNLQTIVRFLCASLQEEHFLVMGDE